MIPVSKPDLDGNEGLYVDDAITQGWVSSRGDYVTRFEEEFSHISHAKHALAVVNGTAAMHLALAALGVGRGDEVIVPALSYIATANAVTYTGAKPVFADVDPETWNIDPESVARLVNSRTRAVVAVHLFGSPANMHTLKDLCASFSLRLVEDAAQAHSARFLGEYVGALGDIGAFSFYGNKIITTGEGGMVTTRDPDLAAKAKLLAHQGQSETYVHPVVGYNYRMTNIAAAIGCAQLERLDTFIRARNSLHRAYREALDLPDQGQHPWATRVLWQYAVLVDDRHAVAARLAEAGVETRPMFPVLHHQAHYSGTAPVAEDIAARGLVLPTWVGMTPADIAHISDVI